MKTNKETKDINQTWYASVDVLVTQKIGKAYFKGLKIAQHHWRLSYTNPPNIATKLDNLEYFSYKNLQPPISLRLEMTSQRFGHSLGKCQNFHLYWGKKPGNTVTNWRLCHLYKKIHSSIIHVIIWRDF